MSHIKELVAANTRFAFKLFAETAKQEASKNIFISPSSIAMALTMTYNGANGETREAMAKTLELAEMGLHDVNQANAKLREELEHLDPQVKLAIANSLWAKHGESFNPKFVQRAADYYDAKVANFGASDAELINGWVSDKTNGKIKELVTENDLAITVLMLINAIYFKGNWTQQFDKSNTRARPFTFQSGKKKQHPMMSQSGDYQYLQGKGFQAISLPYGSGQVSLYIFLPGPDSSLEELHKSLTSKNWERWMSQFQEIPGDIVLPRFKVEYSVSLNNALKALDMQVAFDARADFEEMCPGVFIGEVRHKTFVEVNEEGAEAAAATVVMMLRAMPAETFTMIVDRPFFCAIRDNATGTMLFMGSIVDPQ